MTRPLAALLIAGLAALGAAAQAPPVRPKDKGKDPAKPKGVSDDWVKRTAALSGEAQHRAIVLKLRELNDLFNGETTPTYEGGELVGLEFQTHYVEDVGPLKAATRLKRLAARGDNGGKLADLSPLAPLKLEYLDLFSNPVRDLEAVRGMPLKEVHISGTQVADLGPLRGSPVVVLRCSNAPVKDLKPLLGLPLREVDLQGTRVADIGPLAESPLVWLNCTTQQAAKITLAPLAGKKLTFLACAGCKFPNPDGSLLKGMPLNQLEAGNTNLASLEFARGMPLGNVGVSGTKVKDLGPLAEASNLTNLAIGSTGVSDLGPLAKLRLQNLHAPGLKELTTLDPLKGMPLQQLDVAGCKKVRDVAPLAGLKAQSITLSDTGVTDLKPFEHVEVGGLNLARTRVASLAPLKNSKVTSLDASGVRVAEAFAGLRDLDLVTLTADDSALPNLRLLAGMKRLTTLSILKVPATDFAPLKDLPLATIRCDLKTAKQYEALKAIPTLAEVNGKPRKEFFK